MKLPSDQRRFPRNNSDLANGLGNLASRTAAMIEKNSGGKVLNAGFNTGHRLGHAGASRDRQVLSCTTTGILARAGGDWSVIAATDKPYDRASLVVGESDADQQRRATILWTTGSSANRNGIDASRLAGKYHKVWSLLGQPGQPGSIALDDLRWGQLAPSTPLGKSQTLFPRIEKAEAIERMESMEKKHRSPSPVTTPAPAGTPTPAAGGTAAAAAAPQAAPEKIGIEDFTKVEMRVGQIRPPNASSAQTSC